MKNSNIFKNLTSNHEVQGIYKSAAKAGTSCTPQYANDSQERRFVGAAHEPPGGSDFRLAGIGKTWAEFGEEQV